MDQRIRRPVLKNRGKLTEEFCCCYSVVTLGQSQKPIVTLTRASIHQSVKHKKPLCIQQTSRHVAYKDSIDQIVTIKSQLGSGTYSAATVYDLL